MPRGREGGREAVGLFLKTHEVESMKGSHYCVARHNYARAQYGIEEGEGRGGEGQKSGGGGGRMGTRCTLIQMIFAPGACLVGGETVRDRITYPALYEVRVWKAQLGEGPVRTGGRSWALVCGGGLCLSWGNRKRVSGRGRVAYEGFRVGCLGVYSPSYFWSI